MRRLQMAYSGDPALIDETGTVRVEMYHRLTLIDLTVSVKDPEHLLGFRIVERVRDIPAPREAIGEPPFDFEAAARELIINHGGTP